MAALPGRTWSPRAVLFSLPHSLSDPLALVEGLIALQLGHSPDAWSSCDCRQGQATGTSVTELASVGVVPS